MKVLIIYNSVHDRVLTPMLVGGYVSVTITSIIIAGILVNTL